MNENARCQQCGVALTGQAIGTLCANCLLKLALEPPPEDTLGIEEPQAGATQPKRIRYFGDYELVQEIARGGMGVVYKARQVSLNRPVALKMILAGDFSSSAMIERFRTEAEAAARLEHPHIVPIYEIGELDGRHYFSMRFVEGGTLTQALAKGKLSARQAAELMVKVARAVHHAHQHGIIHRDLKPGNILLDRNGEPSVADFGLAKLVEHDSALTQSAAILGTPAYMAPEQALGQMKQATTAVDIYSLGAILYELLTGRPPFTGPTSLDVLVQVREREPASPRSLKPELDRDLTVICLKCLEKDPLRRYGSAEALAEELQRWLADEPIQARRTTTPQRIWKWARRKPAVAGLVVALHLVGIAGIVGILWQSHRANLESRRAWDESRRAENELWNANLSEARARRIAGGPGARVHSGALVRKLLQRPGLTEAQLLSLREEAIAQLALTDVVPPERWVANPSRVSLAWNSRLDHYVWSAGRSVAELREFPSERTLAAFFGPPHAEFHKSTISPDEQWLVVRYQNGDLRGWQMTTHEEWLRAFRVEKAKFSPDGQTLLLVTAQGIRLHPVGMNGTGHYPRAGRRARDAVYSADGKSLAVLLSSPGRAVEIWDVASGAVRAAFSMEFNPSVAAWNADATRLALGGDRGRLEWRAVIEREDESLSVGDPVPLIGHLSAVQTIQFLADNRTLLTHAWDPASIFWDLTTGQPLLRELKDLGSLDTQGQRVVMARASSNSVATILHPTGYSTVAFAGQPREAHAVRVSPDGRLGVATYDSTVSRLEGDCILWDFASGLEIARFKGIDAVFSADSRTLFTFERYNANRVRRYDVSAENLSQRAHGWDEAQIFHQGRRGEAVNGGEMAPDGRTLIVAAADFVLFLDTQGQEPVRRWEKPAYSAAPSGDGKWVATKIQRQPAALREINTGTNVFRAPNNGRIRFSPDSRWLATVDPTGVQMRELRPPDFATRYAIDIPEPGPLAFAPDSRTFAMVVNKTHVRLHDAVTGRELATLSPPNLAAISGGRALDFSPDGQWLLAAKHDGEVVAWHLPTLRSELAKMGLDWEDRPK